MLAQLMLMKLSDNMEKISAIIITYNEEKNIRRCLSSLKDVAEEIIVVDSLSTDNTRCICSEFNILFYERGFDGYAEQKNWAISKANNNIILAIDADEELSEKLKKSINDARNNWNYDGYRFNRKTNYCGKWINFCGWYPDKQLRLFNKQIGRWNTDIIHEKIEFKKGAKIGFLNGDLLHYSFYNIKQHKDQIERFSELKAEMLFSRGKKTNILLIIISPVIKFLINYVFKLGFLDGYYGFIICINSAYSKYLSHIKLSKKYEGK